MSVIKQLVNDVNRMDTILSLSFSNPIQVKKMYMVYGDTCAFTAVSYLNGYLKTGQKDNISSMNLSVNI